MLARIRDEGLNHSHAYAMLDTIATVFGPRLTASPAYMRAANWARDRFAALGSEQSASRELAVRTRLGAAEVHASR